VTFIPLEASSFPVKLRAVLGDPKQVFPQFTKFVGDMNRYMIIETGISMAAGILIGTWLYVLGVDSPFSRASWPSCSTTCPTSAPSSPRSRRSPLPARRRRGRSPGWTEVA